MGTIKHAEGIIRGNSYETGVIVDKDGFVLAAYKGGRNSVNFGSDTKLVKGNIVTHNHPGSSAFSLADIHNGLVEMGARGIRAAGSSGTYSIVAKNQHANASGFDKAFQQAYNGFRTKRASHKKFSDRQRIWLEKNASKYGYAFTFEEA